MIPALGPEACKDYLLWAFWIARALFGSFGPWKRHFWSVAQISASDSLKSITVYAIWLYYLGSMLGPLILETPASWYYQDLAVLGRPAKQSYSRQQSNSTCRLYHTPFLGYRILVLGSQTHKVGYPKKGVWYEPTGFFKNGPKENNGDPRRQTRSQAGFYAGASELSKHAARCITEA